MNGLLKIGELATQAGVSPRTVDYYTQLGLLHPAQRTGGGFRMYDPTAVETINTIRSLEQHGISLSDISSALDGVHLTQVSTAFASLAAQVDAVQSASPAGSPHAQALLMLIAERTQSLLDIARGILDAGGPL